MTAPTLSEPRPDDEGRETPRASTCAVCEEIIGFRELVQFWDLHDGRRYVHAECIRAAIEQARFTPHPAPLGATDEGRDMADRLCECGHAESGHVESGWWTGSDIACVVCYDGQGGNTAVPPCKRFRAALQATP